MTYQLIWLPQVLRAAGLKVAEQPGWATAGRGDMDVVQGIICHHTGVQNPGNQNMPTLKTLSAGRSDLPGPLAQLGLGLDGTYYVIAAGRCNHGGVGSWKGISGNRFFIGIEGENSGSEPWPDVQMDAYRRGVAAILTKLGLSVTMCCGHKEYAPHRKWDPVFDKDNPTTDMDTFRADVTALMQGIGSPRPPIPAADDDDRPTLRRGARGPFVNQAQAAVGIAADGIYGPGTEAAVRVFQRSKGLVPDGIFGPKCWAAASTAPE